MGEDKETTVIDGGGTATVVNVISNLVNISGFTIKGGAYPNNAAIMLTTNSNTISDNIITNNSCIGIYVKANDNTITLNDIINNALNGIQVENAELNTISENTIDTNSIGVYLDESSNNTITDNTISNCLGDGVYLTGRSDYLTISFNTITDNLNNGIYASWSEHCTIQGNTIANNGEVNESGIYLTASSYCEIIENTIDGNNEYGIQLVLWCNENKIRQNNFMNNKINAIFFTSALNRWSFNYWNRPRIFPKPIFGIMGIMPWINFDWRPLLTPFEA
jgi:parallel beta-helix repeat protein